MDAPQDEVRHAIEPQFLSAAQAGAIRIRVGQMNRTEFEGVVRDIGRYEINLEVNGSMVTLLKKEITHFSAGQTILLPSSPNGSPAAAVASAKPNVQHEFLEKAIRENHLLTIFLLNGARIKAQVQDFDNFTILVKEGGSQHLYYKHAITTINR